MWFHMSCHCVGMHSLVRPQRFETVGWQLLHWRLHLDTETHGSLAATITMTKLLARDRHTRNNINFASVSHLPSALGRYGRRDQYNTSDDDDASPSNILYTSYNNISRRARPQLPPLPDLLPDVAPLAVVERRQTL